MDLFATNRPSLIKKVKVSLGISDHEVICVESVLTATVAETIPRKVYLWHKANYAIDNDKVVDFCKDFTSHYSISTSNQDLWESFKSFCQACLDLVPHRFYKSSTKQPWINAHIKHLFNRKRRLYNKARSSSLKSD